ncbi:MAG TPA: hypothetical protein VHQ86_00810, partial [Candidatus Saccharimonadia bacterium]|nr:hypothetical protein [Candidatus Saccharimonadia bacterium]
MSVTIAFGILAVILNAIGYVPYIRGILTGAVRPQRVTWGIWTILTTVASVNQIINGGGWSTLFFGSTTILVMIVFALSLTRRGIGGASAFDRAVLASSLILTVFWVSARDTHLSTYIAVAIDGVGALPTIVKAFRRPHTELYLQWVLAAVAGACSFAAVTRPATVLYVYPA